MSLVVGLIIGAALGFIAGFLYCASIELAPECFESECESA